MVAGRWSLALGGWPRQENTATNFRGIHGFKKRKINKVLIRVDP
jgi:hypothetical protein